MQKYVDRTIEFMQRTAKTFFTIMYAIKQPNWKDDPIFTFNEKPGGSRSGTVVNVRHQQGTTTYYMKTHHDAGDPSTSGRFYPDLREIFAYKLLELIKVSYFYVIGMFFILFIVKVGPEVFFPTDDCYTKYFLYIATKEVEGLKLMANLNENELHKEIIVQVIL